MWNLKSLQKPLVTLFLLCLLPLGALAQSIVKGTVNDEAGEPIIGATVKVQGGTTGAITDFNGAFSVQAASNATLSVSYVGYVTETVKVNGRSNIVVVLKEDTNTLNDVVVIGYGTMRKSDISGAVTSVDQEAVMKRIPTNIGQALQGAAAGVMVTQQDGAPDANAAIRIRGVGTINGDANPLYVVDGIQVGTSASFVNPADIERIEILKDASAAAIYGSAGANGVVMITTKHGKKGSSQINITADFGLQTLPYKLKTLDVDTYAASIREARANQGVGVANMIWDQQYDGKRNSIDWQDVMTHAALRQQYGASISGGNDKTQYSLSFGYLDVDGLVVNSNYNRFSVRANVSSKINKYLEVGGDINYVHSQSHGSNAGIGNNGNLSSLRDFAFMAPTLDYLVNNVAGNEHIKVNVKNPDGSYGVGYQQTPDGWEGMTQILGNPYATQMENGDRARNGNDRVQTTAFMDVTFLDTKNHKLDIRTQATYTYWGNNSSDFTGGRHRYNYIGGQLTEIDLQADQTYSFNLSQSNGYSLGSQTYLTYNYTDEMHNLTFMLGNEVGKSWGQWLSGGRKGFPSVDNRDLGLAELEEKSVNGAYNADIHTISYFGRLSYVLMDRYILTATLRRDGSSNFGPGNRWGTFPSAAVAWRVSEEPFMKDIKAIDNLKLRIGWGQTGNAGNMTGRAIAALSVNGAYKFYPSSGATSGAWGNGDRVPGWYAGLVDTNLKWETNEMLNFGIDFSFLKNWDITLEYFIKNTKDLLLYQQIRPSAGFTQVYTNYGEIENKGFEFTVNYHKQVNKDFGFNVALNGSTLKNKVKKMGNPLYNTCSGGNDGSNIDGSNVQAISDGFHWNDHSICMEGEAVGSYYGYVTDGIIRNQAELDDYLSKVKLTEGEIGIGDYRWKDINGDGVIDGEDRTIIGNGFPTLNYGITLGATYKDWDFSLYMYGVLGQDILSYSAMRLSTMAFADDQTVVNLLRESYDNAFRAGNENTATLPRLLMIDNNYNMRCSDAWVKNGNFFRVSNLQVGYTLPQDIVRKLSVQKARVYLGVSNLFLFSSYKKYGDPEVGQGSVLYTGLDTGRYPVPRTFMAGLNITF